MRSTVTMLTIGLTIILVAIPTRLPSSGQERPGWNPCGCFCDHPPDVQLPRFNYMEIGAQPCTGIISANLCREGLDKLPKDRLTSICQKLKTTDGFTSFKGSCPVFEKYCGPDEKQPPEKKCDPPADTTPPWFNGDAPCQNRQRGTFSSGQNRRNPHIESVTISICGEVIRFEQRNLWDSSQRRPPVVYSFDVCCDTWQKAASTGSPCAARRDIDCDGELNDTDHTPLDAPSELPSDTDFVSNSPLTNLPFWKQLRPHMPSQSECKNCKWELVRVDYTCKDEVTEYHTTWKCAATGQLKKGEIGFWLNRSRCPIPPSRSWP